MKHPYTKEGRLETVIAMIQLLGFGDSPTGGGELALRGALGLDEKHRVWKIAQQHPEFFMVTGSGGADGRANRSTFLLARFFSQNREEPLPTEYIQSLINTAREIHDRQMSKSKDWRFWVPLMVAAVGGGVTLAKEIWLAFAG